MASTYFILDIWNFEEVFRDIGKTRAQRCICTHETLTTMPSPQLPLLHLLATHLDLSPASLWARITCKDLRKDFTKLIAKGKGQITIAQRRKNLLGSWFALCNRLCVRVTVCMCVCLCVFPQHHPSHPPLLPHAIYPFCTN